MTINEYKINPTATLSIPYWKWKRVNLPDDMKIVHEKDYKEDVYRDYEDETYFRLVHKLENIIKIEIPMEYTLEVIKEAQYEELIKLIDESYTHLGIRVTMRDIKDWTESKVYEQELWIGAYHGNRLIGAIILEVDLEVGEVIVEWLQVLPEYRGMNIGSMLLYQALTRAKTKGDFVTVTGMVRNSTNPERVYRKCGFEGDDVWHILRYRSDCIR